MKIQILALALSLSLPAFADESRLPVEGDAARRGYDIAPVLKCPAVPEAYSKMITQLNVLKTSIKKEAACEPLNMEVQGLESLLGKKRDEVKALIEKSKTETLAEGELETIRKYVEEVTKKVLATAELFNRNNYCFIEDKKNLSFSDLASITLDATALAKTIAGPWATPIALGGQALAGIFQGLNTVVKSRKGYDFTKLEQRQAYVQSLCAYYNYRQDINYLLYPQSRASQLRTLENTLTSHLKGVVDNCPECSGLAQKLISNLKGEKEESRGRRNARQQNVKPNEGLNAEAAQINALYVKPLGTYTVRTLTTLKWITSELDRIAADTSEDATIGRDFLSEIKADIDRFIFEKEAPNFINFQSTKGFDLFREFATYTRGEGDRLMMQAVAGGQGTWVDMSRMHEADVLKTVAGLEADARSMGKTSLAARIAQYKAKSMELLERTRLAAGVNETYCTFFQRAGVYSANLQYACEGMAANAVRRNLQRLAGSDFVPQPILPSVPQEHVTDWVDSLSKVIQHINKDPNRYQKKNDIRPQ